MADTLARPTRNHAGTPAAAGAVRTPHRAPVAVVGALTAVGVAIAGIALVTLAVIAGWIATPRHAVDTGVALRLALQAWLLAQHATVNLANGHIGMVPLGLTAALAVILYRAGRRVARLVAAQGRRQVIVATAALAIPYALLALLMSVIASGYGVSVDPLWALCGSLALATAFAGLGACRESGVLATWRDALPPAVRTAIRCGFAATATLLAGGLLATAVSLGLHAERVGALSSSLQPGGVGMVLLALLGLVLAPNAAIWAASYGAGPGFAVGAGTSVSLFGTHLGAVPAFPPLAALPGDGSAPALAFLVVLVPLAAGGVAGWLAAAGTGAPGGGPKAALLAVVRPCLGAGVVAGALMGVAAWLSGGSVGPGRMAVSGPPVWNLVLVVAGEIAALALLVAWLRAGGAGGLRSATARPARRG